MAQVVDIICDADNRHLQSNVILHNLGFNDFKYLAPPIITKEDLAKFVDEFYVNNLPHEGEINALEQVYLRIFHLRNNIENDGIFVHINSISNIKDLWGTYNILEKRLYRANPTTGELAIVDDRSKGSSIEILPGISFAAPQDSVIINLRGRFSFMYTRNYNRIVLYVFNGDLLQKVLDSCK